MRIDTRINNILFIDDYHKLKDNDLVEAIRPVLNKSRMIKLMTSSSLSNDDKLSVMYEFLFTFNYAYKCCGMLILTRNHPAYHKLDEYLDRVKTEFFKSVNLSTFEFDHPEVCKTLERYKLLINRSHINSIVQKIEKNKIDNPDNLTYDTETISEFVPDLPPKIIITRDVYYYLQKKVKDRNTRLQIEQIYTNTDNCLQDLARIIINRYNFALEKNCPTYFDYIKKSDTDKKIKVLISSLIENIKDNVQRGLVQISQHLKITKVSMPDIIHYYERIKPKQVFNTFEVIRKLPRVLSLFDLSLSSIEGKEFNVMLEDQSLGVLVLDLEKSVKMPPTCVHICQEYTDINNNKYPTKVALIAGYGKVIRHQDIVALLKAFGDAIQILLYPYHRGINFSVEFDGIISSLFEYIAYSEIFVQDDIHWNYYRSMIGFSIKMKCVNALFDHTLHSSSTFVENLKNASRQDVFLKRFYQSIFNKIFGVHDNIFDTTINGINPVVIYQEINGMEGKVYEQIVSNILGYGLYKIVRNGRGIEIIKKLRNKFNVRETLNELLNNTNSLEIYLEEVVG